MEDGDVTLLKLRICYLTTLLESTKIPSPKTSFLMLQINAKTLTVATRRKVLALCVRVCVCGSLLLKHQA